MYSKNNVLLPSKSAYSLEEACKELNLFFNRDDIDIRYILDLVHQGHIWMHAKFSKNNYLFAIPMEWELDENFNNENEKENRRNTFLIECLIIKIFIIKWGIMIYILS